MKEKIKKTWKVLFSNVFGTYFSMQVFFVLGLIGGSAKVEPFFVGLFWFGISTFWMIGMSNRWDIEKKP